MMKIRRPRRNRRDNRGSALLVSLMVIVGLSLLGLGFVAISETESAIAKNQQNALQTQTIAEAGAKMIVEWFQDPLWAEAYAALPLNNTAAVATGVIPTAGAIKTNRVITGYSGVYKPKTSVHLCDKPYRPDNDNRFFGDEDHADIIINRANAATAAMIDAFNDKLLASDGASATALDKLAGEVTEIRIFAPPIVGGTLTSGFWAGGSRYGVATIKVTAQQFVTPPAAGAAAPTTGVLSSHSVRLVVGELPLPIPAGPIQGDANVSFGGNFRVHWGMETSRGDLTPSLNLSSLPWATQNAYERPHYERGYEQGTSIASITITSGGVGYNSAPPVNVTPPTSFVGTAVVDPLSKTVTGVTIAPTGHGGPYNPDPNSGFYPTVTFPLCCGATTQATGTVSVGREIWPVITGTLFDDQDYFHELLAKSFQDPFYGARAYGNNFTPGCGGTEQCFPYAYTEDEAAAGPGMTPSYAFQFQDKNQYAPKKKVTFPIIKYDYWKKITQAGKGYKGIYYFKYDHPGTKSAYFTKFGQGTAQTMAFWVNTMGGAKLGPGVYFFDTTNGQNPQGITDPVVLGNVLTPVEDWQSADFGGQMLMSGFVYINANSYGTTGQGSNATTVQANFPGEPFRDVGYPRWDTASNNWDTSCGGQICRVGIGDGVFSCQDLNNNGKCDIVVMQAPTWNSYDSAQTQHTAPFALPACGTGCTGGKTTYVVKTWKGPDQATADYGAPCTIPAATYDGTNPLPTDCSEPHEPYLNLIFPDQAADNNGAPYNVVVGWEPPNNQTYRPKTLDHTGAVIPCTPPDPNLCTTNGYDVDGAVVPLSVILQGILYQEGQWGSEGNAWFFGSILVQNVINLSSGTADVWFDEKLLKGTWAPPNMPRVIVFSEQTDEQTQ